MVLAVFSLGFLGAYFGVSQLDISPEVFSLWNNITALVSCSTAPIAWILGILALRSTNDSKPLGGSAIVLTGVPYLILFTEFIFSLIQSN